MTSSQMKSKTKAPTKKASPLISEATLRQIYSAMLRCSMLQERMRKPRSSRKHPAGVSLCAEPEAILAGSAIGLRPVDAIALLQGDIAALAHLRGASLRNIFAQVGSHPSASAGAQNILPAASTPEALLHQSLGFAWAHAQQKDSAVVAVYFNSASISIDTLQKALRHASTHKLPILFVCATEFSSPSPQSAPRQPMKREDMHVHAHTCGVPGIPVDGADAVAMYRVAFEALQRARNGGGPTLMEAKILPEIHPATGSPLAVMERYMEQRGLFDSGWKKKTAAAFARELYRAAASAAARDRKGTAKKRRG